VAARLPLSTLLSQALVAFTIEFDNEFEHRTPHTTTRQATAQGPWLASLAMWSNCMQFVREEGVTVRELQSLARTGTNLDGMRRWGYITIEPGPGGSPAKKARPDSVLRPTEKGRIAQEIWRPLFRTIEQRWEDRFGKGEIGRLRESLRALIGRMDLDLPDCLPILGYGLFSKDRDRDRERQAPAKRDTGADSLPLSALLSRVLLAFAIEFERDGDLSLAISANLVRVLDDQGVKVRDLPLLSGVSKEAISMATGYLQKRGYLVIQADPSAGRTKLVRLTPKGREAQGAYRERLRVIEARWQARFGDEIRNLREALELLIGESTARSPLFRGLEPYPDGWRASVPKPSTLPHFPMVLHRGGYPDGS
jgi:DNA-binding MarR family transcriptional regulator